MLKSPTRDMAIHNPQLLFPADCPNQIPTIFGRWGGFCITDFVPAHQAVPPITLQDVAPAALLLGGWVGPPDTAHGACYLLSKATSSNLAS